MEFRNEGHLGGYVIGGDPKTFNPKVWDALIEHYKPKSMIDVGCGEGHALDYFKSKGVNACGVDGIPQGRQDIYTHDYTKGPLAMGLFDLAWCCEFVEHVEEQYMDNFMLTLAGANVIAMTHALPGQPGHHHVNCQFSDYWAEKFKELGFGLAPEMSLFLRHLEPDTWFGQTGMVFTKGKSPDLSYPSGASRGLNGS